MVTEAQYAERTRLIEQNNVPVLDYGYVRLVEPWGSDERIIESARMSTGKSFLGWGTKEEPGDEKLLRHLYKKNHTSPFEMAGATLEIQAPLMVFREWHRHRTQCLGPDTLIHFDAPKSRENRRFVYKMRIEDLWKKWQPTVRQSRPERQTNPFWPRSRIQAMQLRCLDEEAREVVHTKIVDIIKGEPKPMIQVSTVSGRTLVATRAHRVMTSIGWTTLGTAVDSRLLLTLEGTTREKSQGWEVPPIDEQNEEWRPVVGWKEYYEVSNQGRVRRVGCTPKKTPPAGSGYPMSGLNRPGEATSRTVHTLVLEAFVGLPGVGEEALHANNNRLDARLSNLSWGTSKRNSEDMVSADRQQRLVPLFEEIVEVREVGELPTFDLAVEGPWHNFIADGFVVHNSYSEMSARYAPLPDVNYVPTVSRLMLNQGSKNKQAGAVDGAEFLTEEASADWLGILQHGYDYCELIYQAGLKAGVPKELARLILPVGRYSRMRASANLHNWLRFLTLRLPEDAQWEIRSYAAVVAEMLSVHFPRTMALFGERMLHLKEAV